MCELIKRVVKHFDAHPQDHRRAIDAARRGERCPKDIACALRREIPERENNATDRERWDGLS